MLPLTQSTHSRRKAVTSAGGNTYRDLILADAPLAYWRLGEASGTTAADELGTYAATYNGSPTLGVAGAVSGDANTAATFGANVYANVNSPAGLACHFSGPGDDQWGTAPALDQLGPRHQALSAAAAAAGSN